MVKEVKEIKTQYILLLLLWFSCGRENNTGSPNQIAPTYYLEKVDSIQIDRGNISRVLDYSPVKNRFLAFDQITQEFLVFNDQGQILESVYREGEGPNEYNSSLIAASFNDEDGGYFMLSSIEFLRYNEKWEVEERIRFTSYVQLRFYSGPKVAIPYYSLSGTSENYFFTSFFSGINTFVGSNAKEISPDYLIEQYNPTKKSIEWKLPFETELLPEFESNEESGKTKPTQVFSLDKEANLLYLTFERSKEIGVYDIAEDFKLQKKIKFDHESFLHSNKSKNTGLFNFGDEKFAVLYYKGLSEAATEARKINNSGFPLHDPSLYSLILVEAGFQQEMEFPMICEPHLEFIKLPGNRIMLRDKFKGAKEPEHSNYSIFELKQK